MLPYPNAKEELEQLQELLQIEKKAEQEQFNALLKKQSPSFRRQQGMTWYPLLVRETGFGLGDYPFAVLERTAHTDIGHHFHGGKTVRLWSGNDEDDRGVQGVINYVSKDRMKVIFFANDFPDVLDQGKLGVDLLFDENSYREMEKALKLVKDARNCRLADLRDSLLGYREAEMEAEEMTPVPTLNTVQNRALQQIVDAVDCSLVHGPPGTGKTSTLTQAVKKLVNRNEKVLVCAPSNAATDLLTERLAEEGLRVIRVGHISRIDQGLYPLTLEGALQGHTEYKTIKDLKKRSAEFKSLGRKYKRHFGKAEREQRKYLLQEARSLSDDAVRLENQLVGQLVDRAQVISATLVGSANRYIEHLQFDTVVIDEAAQALEPATWVPICRSHKVMLAGDPFQLPPTVKTPAAERQGLNRTLIEKGMERQLPATMLEVQYRMHQTIMGFSNDWFYQSKLVADDAVKDHQLANDEPPLAFVDTAGTGFEEETDPESLSTFNEGEAGLLQKHLDALVENHGLEPHQLGVITPYKAQAIRMREQMHPTHPDLAINTVDAFQGQERDVIYLSLVRSNEEGKLGFLTDYRRMNVAMTRARKKLVVMGDSATLGKDAFYAKFLEYCEQHNAYFSAWEWM